MLPDAGRSMYFYPRPPRGGRPRLLHELPAVTAISIHALREEGDRVAVSDCNRTKYFYPRPPRGGRLLSNRLICNVRHFYPRPPRGGRRRRQRQVYRAYQISIHALREEGDMRYARKSAKAPIISIHALREEGDRYLDRLSRASPSISIHALREEGDRPALQVSGHSTYFYPRPPRGGRRNGINIRSIREHRFLSTPSARRATPAFLFYFVGYPISIHALREEGDVRSCCGTCNRRNFYPRPPRGGRLSPKHTAL